MIASAGAAVGRPRDETRDAAILDATLRILGDVGYDRLTIDAVAAEAKASKATVYRRWPGKAALVVDAIQTLNPYRSGGAAEPPDTGSLRGDVLAGVGHFAERLHTEEGRLLAAVVTAQTRDPELASAMRAATYEDKCRTCRIVVDRAVARGESVTPGAAELFVEVLPALMFNRLLITGEPFDEAFVRHVVDDIVMPLLTRPTPSEPSDDA